MHPDQRRLLDEINHGETLIASGAKLTLMEQYESDYAFCLYYADLDGRHCKSKFLYKSHFGQYSYGISQEQIDFCWKVLTLAAQKEHKEYELKYPEDKAKVREYEDRTSRYPDTEIEV
jgi:hypothetical protein